LREHIVAACTSELTLKYKIYSVFDHGESVLAWVTGQTVPYLLVDLR